VINTALPRVNQYFAAWHEVYHLVCEDTWKDKVHEVSVDMSIQERRADYFAAKALMGNVYQYYQELKQEEFLDNIALCMDVYQVPYKAILIQLYEESKDYKDYELQEIIKRYFDLKSIDWKERFQKLGLDQELVEASNVIYLGYLEEKITEKMMNEPEVSAHELNKKYLESLKEKVKILLCSKG
jgi:Zn-dependent peptidase ImmA (M78 family)